MTPVLGSAPSAAMAGRDAHLDNAKFVLITLVVIGHALTDLRSDSELASALYRGIYLFHMPAFVFVVGHLTAKVVDPGRAAKVLRTAVVPYLVFQALYLGFDQLLAPDPTGFSLLRPYWLMWFLMAVILWRLTAPVFLALRAPVVWAVAISLVAPMSDEVTRFLSLNRALGMLPFFVAGLVLPAGALRELRQRVPATLLGLVGLGAIVVGAIVTAGLDYAALYYTFSYGSAAADLAAGLALRALVLAAGVIGVATVFLLTPVRRQPWTVLGAGSIGGYLLHGFLVRTAGWTRLTDGLGTAGEVALVVVAALAITVLLCSPPVVRALRPLTAPRLGRVTRPSTAPAAPRDQVARAA